MGAAYVAAVASVITAIIVAIVGPIVTRLVVQHSDEDDLDVIRGMAALIADLEDRLRETERRLARCEERARRR